jgi:hypothetical protein
LLAMAVLAAVTARQGRALPADTPLGRDPGTAA